MIITTFRSSYTWEPPQNIIYRYLKIVDVQKFLNGLETNLMLEKQASMFVSYDKLTKILKETTDKHAEGSGQPSSIYDKRSKYKQIMRRSKSKNLDSSSGLLWKTS